MTLVVHLHSRAPLEHRFDASHTSTLHEHERQYQIVIAALMLSHCVWEAACANQAAVESLWHTVYACIGCGHPDKWKETKKKSLCSSATIVGAS